jgi:hypothetical protein
MQEKIYEDTIGGSDLSVFFLSEVWTSDKPDLIIVDLDNTTSVSYSRIRERFPIRQLGRSNPVAYTDGIVTTAGHIAFNVFCEDALARLRGQILKEQTSISNNIAELKNRNTAASNVTADILKNTETAFQNFNSGAFNTILNLDQLPPFHLLIMGVNERGVMSKLLIRDISIADENQYHGTQQPNIMNKVSFLALDVIPLYQSPFK